MNGSPAQLRGQLVLSRRHGEAVVLLGPAGEVLARVTVGGIGRDRGQVRLAIATATGVSASRDEVAATWTPRAEVKHGSG